MSIGRKERGQGNESTRISKHIEFVDVVHNEEDSQESAEIDLNNCSITTPHYTMASQNSEDLILIIAKDATECNNSEETEIPYDNTDLDKPIRGRPKKGRKRLYSEHTRAQSKNLKYANLPYHNGKKLIEPKTFKDYVCQCQKQCSNLITKEKREEEFQKYVTLGSYEAQLLYLVNCISERPKSRSYFTRNTKTNRRIPKQYSRSYRIGNTQVCRDMFLNNFQITSSKVNKCLIKFRKGLVKDGRGHNGGWNKTSEEDVDFIKQFIESLPKDNKRDKNNGRQYLKFGMPKVYELYLEEHKNYYGESKKPSSFAVVKNTFYNCFNLRCKPLKKDI